jgi:hypothetical protein
MTEVVGDLFIDTKPFLQVPANKKIISRASDLSSFLQYNATSANASNINFVFTVPSTGALIADRSIVNLTSVAVDFVVTNSVSPAAAQTVNFFQQGSFALRDYAFHRWVNNVSITMAGSTYSLALNDILPLYRYCVNDSNDMTDWGSFGGARDELAGAYNQAGDPFQSNASLLNSLGGVGTQDLVSASHRGIMNIEKLTYNNAGAGVQPYAGAVTIAPGTSCVFTCQFSLSEMLMLPLFNFMKKEGISLTHVSQIQLNFTMGNLASMFSTAVLIDSNNNISLNNSTGVVNGLKLAPPTFNNNAPLSQSNTVLNMEFITPPAGASYSNISKPFYDVQRYISTTQNIPVAVTADQIALNTAGTRVISQSVSLPVIPDKMFIFVCAPKAFRQSTQGMAYNDAFAPIRRLYITLGSRTNQLASNLTSALYLTSIRNGLKGVSWTQFKGFAPNPDFSNSGQGFTPLASCGVLVDIARDLGLPSNMGAAGLQTPISLQIQADIVSQGLTTSTGSEQLELYTCTVNNGYYNITSQGSSNIIQGGLTDTDIATLIATPIPEEEAHVVRIGGDFFGSVRDFARNLAPMARKVYNAVGSVAPYIDAGLKSLGAGMTAGARKKSLKQMAM